MSAAAGLPLPRLSRGRFAYAFELSDGQQAAGDVHAYTDETLAEQCGVRVAFSERDGGFSAAPFASLNVRSGLGDCEESIQKNRAAICAALEGDARIPLVSPDQVHATSIFSLDDSLPEVVAQAQKECAQGGYDAVQLSCAGVGAMLCFADCLPLILVAPGGQFSVVHCGWRGTVNHLAALSFVQLVSSAACEPGQVNAYIGPYIHAECFEVGQDTAQLFTQEFGPTVVENLGGTSGSAHVHLGNAVRWDLLHAGAATERIADVDVCTVCNTDRFFSYRAEPDLTGRHGAFAYCRP